MYPRGNHRVSLYRRLGGPQVWSGRVRKISPLPGFHPGQFTILGKETRNCSVLRNVQSGSGARTATCWIGTVGFLSRLKRPERQADYSPPSSAEVKISGAIHLLSSMPSRRAQGQPYLVIKVQIIDSSRLLTLLTELSFCSFFSPLPHFTVDIYNRWAWLLNCRELFFSDSRTEIQVPPE